MVRIGINGFGRIGRNIVRAALQSNAEVEFVAVNDLTDAKTLAYLLKYDSVHGTLAAEVSHDEDSLTVDGRKIRIFSNPDPAEIPWGEVGAEVVIESTGRFSSRDKAALHIRDSVEHVIISAPAKNADITVCIGANEDEIDPSVHKVISNASCTTNCLAPIARVLHEKFTITRGIMTTVHSYTNDQVILDLPHKDPRRGRAAALSIIPTSTGAAKAVGLVLPELAGKLDGISLRVPTPNVSVIDFVFNTEKATSAEEINDVLREASEGAMGRVLTFTDEHLVSVDFNNDTHSAVVDMPFTRSVDPHMHKVMAWYDNEYGYSNRMVDVALHLARKKKESLAGQRSGS
jgi:glyceraldehyde 3-phosphate dehydrogenase